MGHARIGRTAEARARAIVETVTHTTQKRSAALHALRWAHSRIKARRRTGRVDDELLIAGQSIRLGQIPVRTPLPYIAGHVIQTVAVGWKRLDRGGTRVAI